MKIYPETPAPLMYSSDINEHLRGTWWTLRNALVADQDAVKRCHERIAAVKREMKFFKTRIVATHHALAAIDGIKEPK